MMTDEQKEQQRRLADDLALRFLLSNRHGRRFLWKHMGDCGLTLSGFAGEQPITMAFNNGRQSVAQSLLADINRVRPGAFAQMINEAQLEEESYHDHRASNDHDGSGDDRSPNDYNERGEYDPLGAVIR